MNYRINYLGNNGFEGNITVDEEGVPLRPYKNDEEEILIECMLSTDDIDNIYEVGNIELLTYSLNGELVEWDVFIELLEPSNSPIYHDGEISYFKPVSLDEFKKAYKRNQEFKQSVFENKGTNKLVFSKGLCFYTPHKKA